MYTCIYIYNTVDSSASSQYHWRPAPVFMFFFSQQRNLPPASSCEPCACPPSRPWSFPSNPPAVEATHGASADHTPNPWPNKNRLGKPHWQNHVDPHCSMLKSIWFNYVQLHFHHLDYPTCAFLICNTFFVQPFSLVWSQFSSNLILNG